MNLQRDTRGSALIEAALCLPVLALMLCGGTDLIRANRLNQVVTSATRAGVQYAILNPADLDGVKAAVLKAAAGDRVVAIVKRSGRYISIEAQAEMRPIFNVSASAFPKTASAKATVQVNP